MADKYGRAGKSTRQMAEKRRNKSALIGVVGSIVGLIFILMFLGWIPVKAGPYTAIILLFLALIAKAMPDILDRGTRNIDRTARQADRGAEAEEDVAELLEELDENFVVLNDIASPYGNIDHIVIHRENGIFLIETKSHRGRIDVESGEVLLNGHGTEKNFIGQVLQNCYWLRDAVKEKLGVTVWITPVLVFTKAFVPFNRGVKGVRVVNQRYLLGVLRSQANPRKENVLVWERREELVNML